MATTEEIIFSPKQSFSLEDDDSVFLIKNGKIDIFIVYLDEKGFEKNRFSIGRFEKNNIIFGVNVKTLNEEKLNLIATPLGDVQLIKKNISDFLSDKNTFISSIEKWFSILNKNIVSEKTNNTAINYHSNKKITLNAGDILKPQYNDFFWVSQINGLSIFLNDLEYPKILNNIFLPLSIETWIQSKEKSLILIKNTNNFFSDLSEIDVLHQIKNANIFLMKCIFLEIKKIRMLEHERLEKKIINDANNFKKSIDLLAGISKQSTAHSLPASGNDFLLDACNMIGNHIDLVFSSRKDSGNRKNTLENICTTSKLRYRKIALKGEWWKYDHGPLLVYMQEDDRPAALIFKNGSYKIHDTTLNNTYTVKQENADSIQSFGFMFYRPFKNKALTVLEVMKFGGNGCEHDIFLIVLMGIAGGILNMITPMATGMLFDTVIPEAEKFQLIQLTLALIGGAIGIAMFEFTRSVAMLRVEGKMDFSIQAAVWDRLLALPIPFFRDFTAGDLAMRANGITTIRQALSGTTMNAILGAVFSIFNLGLLFYYNWFLALVAIGLMILVLIVTIATSLFKLRYERQLAEIDGEVSGLLLQLLSAVSKLKTTGSEARAFAVWANQFSRHRLLSFKAENIGNILETFNATFPLFSSFVIFMTVAFFLEDKKITTGEFLAFNSAFVSFLLAILSMTAALVTVLQIIPLYERAKPILETIPEVDAIKAHPGQLSGNIEVSHLNFSYKSDGPLILKDISLNIKKGQFVAIVGSSGSGKSTLLRCLLGFEILSSGSIYYDGQDMSVLDITAIRRQLGVVLQNGQILPGDIFKNIVGSSGLSIDDAWYAARMCGLEQDIKDMPMGMHTVVMGGVLSGGQIQRILIARAIVHKPKIIYFDEATSALDNKTQAIVSQSLERLEATRIVIAHRLSTVKNADLIVVLDDGIIKEKGTYEELMHNNGLFTQLAKRQIV